MVRYMSLQGTFLFTSLQCTMGNRGQCGEEDQPAVCCSSRDQARTQAKNHKDNAGRILLCSVSWRIRSVSLSLEILDYQVRGKEPTRPR